MSGENYVVRFFFFSDSSRHILAPKDANVFLFFNFILGNIIQQLQSYYLFISHGYFYTMLQLISNTSFFYLKNLVYTITNF